MRVCFMGSMKFAVPILEGLQERYDVVLVVTQPDKPVGRKKVITPTPVKVKAQELGLKVFQPMNIKEDYQTITDLKLDLMIVAAYGQMIPEHVLSHAKRQAINVHASLLPKYRGGSPMHRAIQYGDEETGVSIMYMAMKMDSGEILAQRAIPIEKEDNVGTMEEKLSIIGRDLLLETLENIDQIMPTPQDTEQVTFARNIKPEEEYINFRTTAENVFNHVRGFNPWPLTYCVLEGKKFKLHQVDYVDENVSEHPGEIVRVDGNGVYVQTLDGLVILKNIQMQGKTPMDIQDFMNGVGRTLFQPGKMFE